MATLRNLAISLHRLAGATNVAAASQHLSRHPNRVLPLLKYGQINFPGTLSSYRRRRIGLQLERTWRSGIVQVA